LLQTGQSGNRNAVEERFSANVQTGLGTHSELYTMGTGSYLGVKSFGRGVDHANTSNAMLQNEYSYTSTTNLGLRGLL